MKGKEKASIAIEPKYAILRFAKYKGPEISAIEAHNERTKEKYESNEQVDLTRTKYNFHLVTPTQPYRQEAEQQIKAAGCRTRKDSTRMVEALFTVSTDYFKGKSTEQIRAFYQEALDFFVAHQGRETIISAVVHMDEATPHMHLTFVPLTADGRLSAKEILGNKKHLTWWQDEYWKHMVRLDPNLERGESASKTGRTHIPPRLFKELTKLTKQRNRLNDLLDGINAFNAKSRAEEIRASLDKYITSVEYMQTQLKKYKGAFTDTMAENKRLKTAIEHLTAEKEELEVQLKAAATESIQKKLRAGKLQEDYEKARSILSRIPPEVLRYYTANVRPQQGRTTPNRPRKGDVLE